jgi:predicted neuraminidase
MPDNCGIMLSEFDKVTKRQSHKTMRLRILTLLFLSKALFLAALSPVAPLSYGQSAVMLTEEFVFEAAPFPACHASTIVEANDGTLVAAWFGGLHEKADDVGIWLSRRVNERWSDPVEVANGIQFRWDAGPTSSGQKVQRYPTWNPVLFQPRQGPLLLFYKAGPTPQTWWGMLTKSDDHGVTWSSPERLPEGILGPIKNKPIEIADGTILCPSSHETPDTDGWTVHFESTNDLGKTWSRTPSLTDPKTSGVIQPSLLRLGGDRLLAVGRSRQGKVFQMSSQDLGKTWSELQFLELPNPNSGTDALTLKDGRHLLVYNHVTKQLAEWGGKRSPLNIALSNDGVDWKELMTLESEPKKEFSYPAIIQTRDGKIHVTYTWKRERIKHVVLELR